MPQSAEWNNFLCSCRRQPWLIPGYGCALLLLVYRRLTHKIRLRLMSGPHRGLKIRPAWLDRTAIEAPMSGPLFFPPFPVFQAQDGGPDSSFLALDPQDPEGILAQNRWRECVLGSLLDGATAASGLQQALEWLQQPRSRLDVGWEPYSCCERVVNLAILLARHPELCARCDETELRHFFSDTAQWIDARLEYYGPERTNNHILNNARALVVAGAVLRCLPLLERGLTIFAHMSPRLFLSEGFLRERSSHYQLIVATWVLDAWHFAHQAAAVFDWHPQGLEYLQALAARTKSATSLLLSYLGDSDVHIGDISPDLPPVLSVQRLKALYGCACQPQALPSISKIDDWLMLSHPPYTLLACFPSDELPAPYTTHGHADLCSFVWRVAGQPILVDAGRYRYTADAQSQYQISVYGHNTVVINSLGPLAESVLARGRWCPVPYARTKLNVELHASDEVCMVHNGFSRLPDVGSHERCILFTTDGLIVNDTLAGEGEVSLDLLWHFAPDFSVSADAPYQLQGAMHSIAIHCQTTNNQTVSLHWDSYPFSHAYGFQQSAPQLRCSLRATLPCLLTTIFKVAPCVE